MTDTPPFAITVCGIEELGAHCDAAPTHVLSILDPDHPVPDAFTTYATHARVELRFHDIIEEGGTRLAPSAADVRAILALGRSLAETQPARLLVHCHAGISRSTAGMCLILAQALPHLPAAEVVAMVHGIREKSWPNLRMMELGDAALGRGGSLVAATHALHRLQLEKRPHLAEYMEKDGRGREVAAALALPAG